MKLSRQVQQLEHDNERLQHQNRELRAMLVRLMMKHGNEISTEPLTPVHLAEIEQGTIFLNDSNRIQIVISNAGGYGITTGSIELTNGQMEEITKTLLDENPSTHEAD